MALEMRIMPDYKKMYLKMLAVSEEAMKAKKTMLTNKKDGLIISPSFFFLI